MDSANIFSYVALLSWIPISLIMFSYLRPQTATALALLGAILLLPETVGFDLPIVPEFDKQSAGALGALFGCMWKCRQRLLSARIGRGIDLLWVLLLVGHFLSAFANPDSLVFGPRTLPGLTTYDAISAALRAAITMALPFVLARAVFRTPGELVLLLRVIVMAGLCYSVLALVEIRLSPQLHNWVYGFHAHQFAQAKRDGGFRPTLFMTHGLDVARFFLLVLVSATGLYRMRLPIGRFSAGLVTLYLCAIMVLLKSTAALFYAVMAVPLMAYASAVTLRRLGLVLALVVLVFPMLRANGYIPTEDILDIAYDFSEERGQSLETRFVQEDSLLARALERPTFGWSRYGRNRVYNSRTGNDESITDGLWTLTLGMQGYFGFVALFGLLTFPLIMVWRRLRQVPFSHAQWPVLSLSIACAFLTIDLIPNGLHDYIHLVTAGAVVGGLTGLAPSQSAKS